MWAFGPHGGVHSAHLCHRRGTSTTACVQVWQEGSGQVPNERSVGTMNARNVAFFTKHFRNDEGNASILDRLIELEIVEVGCSLSRH